MESGLLLIDKPVGPTSAKVVQRVKAIMGARKVGHLGSLDPFASGLLLVGVNDGTKVAEIFLNEQKSYTGIITLGVETDTEDRTGQVLEVRDAPDLEQQELERLQTAFTGSLRQVPPMFSALKRGGVPLYRLARQGKTVPRPAREIHIESLRLWKLNGAELGFEVICSKGTYIRTMAADMGRTLGCGGHLKSLRRLTCGHLSVDQAVSMDEVQSMKEDKGEVTLVPLARVLGHFRQVPLGAREESWLRAGRQEMLLELGLPKDGERMVCVSDVGGDLVALAQWVHGESGGRWQLFRVFTRGDK